MVTQGEGERGLGGHFIIIPMKLNITGGEGGGNGAIGVMMDLMINHGRGDTLVRAQVVQ